MKTLYQVNLWPIEPLLFSDNRSARAGEDHLIRDQDPSPHTIYGAIGANIVSKLGAEVNPAKWDNAREYLGDFETDIEKGSQDRAELIGFYYSDTSDKAWLPLPRHVMLLKIGDNISTGNTAEIKEQQSTIAKSSLADLRYYLYFKPDDFETDQEFFFSKEMLKKVLCGIMSANSHLHNGSEILSIEKIYQAEIRLGLGMDNRKNQVKESILFSRPYRRFASDIQLDTSEWRSASITAYFQTCRPISKAHLSRNRLAFLGGDRGRASISFNKEDDGKPLTDLKEEVKQHVRGSKGFFGYLLTPAVKETGWPQIDGKAPLAAATGKPITISGWNTDASDPHPRPLRRLIPAGSVFFYEWDSQDESSCKQLIDRLWLEPIASNNQYRNSGFGRILIGVWK